MWLAVHAADVHLMAAGVELEAGDSEIAPGAGDAVYAVAADHHAYPLCPKFAAVPAVHAGLAAVHCA